MEDHSSDIGNLVAWIDLSALDISQGQDVCEFTGDEENIDLPRNSSKQNPIPKHAKERKNQAPTDHSYSISSAVLLDKSSCSGVKPVMTGPSNRDSEDGKIQTLRQDNGESENKILEEEVCGPTGSFELLGPEFESECEKSSKNTTEPIFLCSECCVLVVGEEHLRDHIISVHISQEDESLMFHSPENESEEEMLANWILQKDEESSLTASRQEESYVKSEEKGIGRPRCAVDRKSPVDRKRPVTPPLIDTELYREFMDIRHKKMQEKPVVRCPECLLQFSSHFKYRLHHLSMHPRETEKKFKCNSCGKRYNHVQSLNVHVRNHHESQTDDISVKNLSNDDTKPTDKKLFICDGCGKDFNRKFNFRRHTNICVYYYAKKKKNTSKENFLSTGDDHKVVVEVENQLKLGNRGGRGTCPGSSKSYHVATGKKENSKVCKGRVAEQRELLPTKSNKKDIQVRTPEMENGLRSVLRDHLRQKRQNHVSEQLEEYVNLFTREIECKEAGLGNGNFQSTSGNFTEKNQCVQGRSETGVIFGGTSAETVKASFPNILRQLGGYKDNY